MLKTGIIYILYLHYIHRCRVDLWSASVYSLSSSSSCTIPPNTHTTSISLSPTWAQRSIPAGPSAMHDRDSVYLAGGVGGGSGTGVGTGVSDEGGSGTGGEGKRQGLAAQWAARGVRGPGAMEAVGALGHGTFSSGLGLDAFAGIFCETCASVEALPLPHPDFNEVPDLGVQKNEFIFCHDHQNKECVRTNCRFVHGSKEDEDYYKKSGELPLRLRGRWRPDWDCPPTDLPLSRGEVPICRDYLKGECQRGNKCKFRHVRKDYECEAPSRGGVGCMMGVTGGVSGMVNAGSGGAGGVGGACGGMSGLVGGGVGNYMGMGCPNIGGCREQGMSGGVGGSLSSCMSMGTAGYRRYDRSPCSIYDPLFENGMFEVGPVEAPIDHTALQLKRRRLEGLRLFDGTGGGHYDLGVQTTLSTRPLEYRLLERRTPCWGKEWRSLRNRWTNVKCTHSLTLMLFQTFLSSVENKGRYISLSVEFGAAKIM